MMKPNIFNVFVSVLMASVLSVEPSQAQIACVPFQAAQQSLLNELQGFGREALVASSLAQYKVHQIKNLNDSGPGSLREALASNDPLWIMFDVDGVIRVNPKDPIKIKSHKVIDGRGRDILVHGGFKIPSGTRHVVISDIALTLADEYPNGQISADLIAIWGEAAKNADDFTTQNIWLNHLDLSRGTDGAIDIRGGTKITVSSCFIHDHEKAMLVSDDMKHQPTTETRLTMYRNHFKSVTRRQPQMHFGKLDSFNNVIDHWWEFGIGVFEGAEAIVENNYFSPRADCFPFGCTNPNSPTGDRFFRASNLGVAYDWNHYKLGSARVLGSVSNGDVMARSQYPERVFNREDYYNLKPVKMDEQLARTIRKEAGPRGRKRYCIASLII